MGGGASRATGAADASPPSKPELPSDAPEHAQDGQPPAPDGSIPDPNLGGAHHQASPAASAPSTPPDKVATGPLRQVCLGTVLGNELHTLTATIRQQELTLLQLSRKQTVHSEARRAFYRSLGAVGALQSLWPDTVPVAAHAACRFEVAELQLALAVEESAAAVALSRGASLRYGALRRRRVAIVEAERFLAELEQAAAHDSVRTLLQNADAKTVFQRQVRAESAEAARGSVEVLGAMRARRETKLLLQQASGAAEFGSVPENWPILDDDHVEACRAAAEGQRAKLVDLNANWELPIKSAKQANATAREKQRVLDSFANLRITPTEVAEVRLQLAADKMWVEDELAALGPDRERAAAESTKHQQSIGAMRFLRLLRQGRNLDGAWLRKHVLPSDVATNDTHAIARARQIVGGMKSSELGSARSIKKPSDDVIAVVHTVCVVLGEQVKSWDAAKKILGSSSLQDQMLGKLEEMADATTPGVPLDAEAREDVLQLMQDVNADTIQEVSESVAALYAFASAAEIYSRAENRCEHIRDIEKLEADTGLAEKREALSDLIGRLPRGEGAKQLRHAAKREFLRAKGACLVLGEARYLNFERAVAVMRTHEENSRRAVAQGEEQADELSFVQLKRANQRYVWARAAREIFEQGGVTGLVGEKVQEEATSTERTLGALAPRAAEKKRVRENLLISRGTLATARRCLVTATHCEHVDGPDEERVGKKDEWLTELRRLHVHERRAMWAAEDNMIACEGAVDELRDMNETMEETQGLLAAVQEFWIYGLEIASKAEEQRLLKIAHELKTEAEQLEAEAERLYKKWKGREAAFARLCNGTCTCNLLTDRVKVKYTRVVIKIEASLEGTKLSVFRIHEGRQDPRPYSQVVLDGCETYVPEPSPAFDPPQSEFTRELAMGKMKRKASKYRKTSDAKGKPEKGKEKGKKGKKGKGKKGKGKKHKGTADVTEPEAEPEAEPEPEPELSPEEQEELDRQKEEAEKLQKMRELFDEIDTDKGGTLDQEEIGRMATLLGIPMSKGELEQAMIEMDEDGSGTVDFEEFAAWWPKLEGKNEALMNALQNKLDGVNVPVKFEDAIMTLTIIPQDMIRGPGARPSRGSATESATASSAGSRTTGGSRDFVFAWDPPDVDVSLRTGDKQGIYQSPRERIAARRVMLEWAAPAHADTGSGGGTFAHASRFVQEITPHKVAFDKADEVAKAARKVAEKAARILEKHCFEAAALKQRSTQRMLVDRESIRLTIERSRAVSSMHALQQARAAQAVAQRTCIALERCISEFMHEIGRAAPRVDLADLRGDVRADEAGPLHALQNADYSYAAIKSSAIRHSGAAAYAQDTATGLVVPGMIARKLDEAKREADHLFDTARSARAAVRNAKVELAVVHEKLRILDRIGTTQPRTPEEMLALKESVERDLVLAQNDRDGHLRELAERCVKAKDDAETAGGQLAVLRQLARGVMNDPDPDSLGLARLDFLKEMAEAALLVASQQGATWKKTKLCREMYRQAGRLDSVWQLQAALRASPGADRNRVNEEMTKLFHVAKEEEVKARNVRGSDQRVSAAVAAITKLHNDSNEMIGGLEALQTISLERETLPKLLAERGIEAAAVIMPGLEAPRQVILRLEIQHKLQLRRMHSEIAFAKMKFEIFSAAVKQLTKQKKGAEQALKDCVTKCKKKGSLHLELWDPNLHELEEHFVQVWATMEAGKITWYRDAKQDEVDYTANLTGCQVICAYDAEIDGPGGGRLPPPPPDPDDDKGAEEQEEEEEEEDDDEDGIPKLNLRFTFHVELDSKLNPPVPLLLNPRQSIKGLTLEAPGSRPSSRASTRSRPSTAFTGSRPNTSIADAAGPDSNKGSRPGSKAGSDEKGDDENAESEEPPPFFDRIGEPPPRGVYNLAITIADDNEKQWTQAQDEMNGWIETFAYNGRYELDLVPLQAEQVKAKERLKGPAMDFLGMEQELTTVVRMEELEHRHVEEEMQAAVDTRNEAQNELCAPVQEERDHALAEADEHMARNETRFGKSTWALIVTGGDPVPEGAIETEKARAETQLRQAQTEFAVDRMADWQLFASLGRQDMLQKLSPLLEDYALGLHVSEVDGVTDAVDTFLSLLNRSDGLVVRCAVDCLRRLAAHEPWRRHLAPVVEMLLHILASEYQAYTRECAGVLRLLSSDRGCRDAIKRGHFTVKQWWTRPLDAGGDSVVRACVACALVRVAADSRIDKPASVTQAEHDGGRTSSGNNPSSEHTVEPLPDWAERAVYALTRIDSDIGSQPGDVTALMHLLHGPLGNPTTDNVLSILFAISHDHPSTCYVEALKATPGVKALAGCFADRLPVDVRQAAINKVIRTRGALQHAEAELMLARRRAKEAQQERDSMDALPRRTGWIMLRRIDDPAALEKLCEEVTYIATRLAAGKKGQAAEELEADFKKKKKKLQKMNATIWKRVWVVLEEGRAMLWERVDPTNGVGSGKVEILELASSAVEFATATPLLQPLTPVPVAALAPGSAGSDVSEQWSPGSRPGTVSDMAADSRPGTALSMVSADSLLGATGDTFASELDTQLGQSTGRNPNRLRKAVGAVRAITRMNIAASRAAAAAAVDAVLEAAEEAARADAEGLRRVRADPVAEDGLDSTKSKGKDQPKPACELLPNEQDKLEEMLEIEPQGSPFLFDLNLDSVSSSGDLLYNLASDGAAINEQEQAIKKLQMRAERRNKTGSKAGSSKVGSQAGRSQRAASPVLSIGGRGSDDGSRSTRLSQISDVAQEGEVDVEGRADLSALQQDAEEVLESVLATAEVERIEWMRVLQRASVWNPGAMRRLEEAAEIAEQQLAAAEAAHADATEAAGLASHAYEMLEDAWRGCKQLIYGISTVTRPSGKTALVDAGIIEMLLRMWQEEEEAVAMPETTAEQGTVGGERKLARGEEQLWAVSMLVELIRCSAGRCDAYIGKGGLEVLTGAISGQQQKAAAAAREQLAREEAEAEETDRAAAQELEEAEAARRQADVEWDDVARAQEELAEAEAKAEQADASGSKAATKAAALRVAAAKEAVVREIAEAEQASEDAHRQQEEADEAVAAAAKEKAEAAAARQHLQHVEADADADDEWLAADVERQRADREIAEAEDTAMRAELEANDVEVARQDLATAEAWLASATNEKVLVKAQAAVDEARTRLATEEAEAAGALLAAEQEKAEAEEERLRVDLLAEDIEQQRAAKLAHEAEDAASAEELAAEAVETSAAYLTALEDAKTLEAQASDRLAAARARLAETEMKARERKRRKLPLPVK